MDNILTASKSNTKLLIKYGKWHFYGNVCGFVFIMLHSYINLCVYVYV